MLGTKRLVDFQAPEDYMYEQIMPLALTKPISSMADTSFSEKVILTVSSLTMKDDLFNPFDSVTYDMQFMDVHPLEQSAF